MENLLGRPEVNKLSESHLWSSYRAYSSASAVEAAKRMAITEYKSWPSNRRNPYSGWKEKTHTALEHISYIEDDVVEAVEALDAGRPVYIGMSVTYSMAKCNAVMDPNSGNNGGGHAVTISGYTLDERVLGGGYFIIKNSWGEDCGDKGYLYMPFHYCLRGGKSYCIMWDLEGIKTAFPDVPNVTPKIPEFSMKKINISLHSYKKWYQRSRTVTMGVEGRSLHVRQIKDITYSIDGAEFSKPVLNKLDKMTFSFKTKSSSHNIALKINLKDGSEVVSTHEWRLK